MFCFSRKPNREPNSRLIWLLLLAGNKNPVVPPKGQKNPKPSKPLNPQVLHGSFSRSQEHQPALISSPHSSHPRWDRGAAKTRGESEPRAVPALPLLQLHLFSGKGRCLLPPCCRSAARVSCSESGAAIPGTLPQSLAPRGALGTGLGSVELREHRRQLRRVGEGGGWRAAKSPSFPQQGHRAPCQF